MISRFDPISLDEMDTVKLMDRVDMKFILPFNRLDTILAELYNSYRVLTICEKGYSVTGLLILIHLKW